MAFVNCVRIQPFSLEAFVLDGVGWFPGTYVLEWGIECTIVDLKQNWLIVWGGGDLHKALTSIECDIFWHILSCGIGCCLEHEFVNQLSVQTTFPDALNRRPWWLSGLRRSRVHSLMIARRSLCPVKLGSNPGQGIKGINFSGWHGLDMSVTVTKRR